MAFSHYHRHLRTYGSCNRLHGTEGYGPCIVHKLAESCSMHGQALQAAAAAASGGNFRSMFAGAGCCSFGSACTSMHALAPQQAVKLFEKGSAVYSLAIMWGCQVRLFDVACTCLCLLAGSVMSLSMCTLKA